MIRKLFTTSFICIVGKQSVLVKNIATTASAYSGFKRFNRETDSVRQTTQTVSDLETTDTTVLPYDKTYGSSVFPTLETHSQMFDGVKYTDLPIVHIRATSNNTIISVSDAAGKGIALKSAGTVGYRNAKKGTNIAAQAAAIALAGDIIRKDVRTVRVCLKGIGPGRLPALKALDLSGIKIVSITDTTPLAHNGNRPKKVRRL